jgi:hypothetical protein
MAVSLFLQIQSWIWILFPQCAKMMEGLIIFDQIFKLKRLLELSIVAEIFFSKLIFKHFINFHLSSYQASHTYFCPWYTQSNFFHDKHKRVTYLKQGCNQNHLSTRSSSCCLYSMCYWCTIKSILLYYDCHLYIMNMKSAILLQKVLLISRIWFLSVCKLTAYFCMRY